jgi:hypothetical protein
VVVSLESIDLCGALVRDAGDGIVMLTGKLVYLLLVGDVGVFKLMKPVLLLARVVLLQALNLTTEALVVSNQLLLVCAMFAGIMLDSNACLGDVNLELASLILRVTDEFFVDNHISLQVIAYLKIYQDMSDCFI